MNFYMGNSINEVDLQDINVAFSDELIDFIYKLRTQVPLDMSKLYGIDPYDDVEISNDDLSQIIEVCHYMIDASLLGDYAESEEGNRMLRNLAEFAEKAMSKNLGLISIGD